MLRTDILIQENQGLALLKVSGTFPLEMDLESPDTVCRFEGDPLEAEDLRCKNRLSTYGK